MVSKSKAAPLSEAHYKYIFPVDRYFAEEFLPVDTLRQLDEGKHQLARAAGVEVGAVEVNIAMHFLVKI